MISDSQINILEFSD